MAARHFGHPPGVAVGTVFVDREAVARAGVHAWAGSSCRGEKWHLGHPDGESVGGPEHVACNTGAPSRLRAKRR
jgi:hypothetical protein